MTIKQINERIKERGLKKTWLAEKLGISNTLFSFYITETRDIPDDKKAELEILLK